LLKLKCNKTTSNQLSLLLILISITCSACSNNSDATIGKSASNSKPITVGWQTVWAPAGEIAQALIHTDIAKQCGVSLDYKGFLFGTEMNEAALNHDLDCETTGSIPAISLLAHSKDWTIVGRFIFHSLAIVARNPSKIKTIADLKGKSVAVPFGSGPHPYLLSLLKKTKLGIGDSDGQVKLINISPSEQVLALQQGSVDAIASWEPQTTIALNRKLGKVIDEEKAIGFIIVTNQLLKEHPDSVVHLLQAYIRASYFVAKHHLEADEWFAKASGFDKQLINQIKVIEPNLSAKNLSQVNLNLSATDIAETQELADIMLENQLIRSPVKLRDRIDLSFLEKANKAI
jgi:sulfonate transport system substrate-binding protein